MRNITVSIHDETYCQARVWAAERDTSISAVVQHLLQTLPGSRRAARGFPLKAAKPAGPRPFYAANSPDQ
jgi:hypothetical protein